MNFKIEGAGFQSFRDRFEFDFSNRGLLAIQGDNRLSSSSDSNGSGKSSLIEALLWGLFEQTLRDIPVDSVINNDLGKDCWVKVTTYLDNGDVLEVNRGRKHKTLKNGVILTLNGGDITKGTVAESNREIEAILGCDFKTFSSSVYFNGTSAIKPFPLIGDKAIKQVIESALGVEIFDRMADGLASRRSAAKVKAMDAEMAFKLADGRLATIVEGIEQSTEAVKAWDAAQRHKIDDIKDQLDRLPPAVDVESMKASAEIALKEHAAAKDELDRLTAVERTIGGSASPGALLAAVSATSAQLQIAEALLADLQQDGKVNAMAGSDPTMQGSIATIRSIDAELKTLTASTDSCPTCGQDISDPTVLRRHQETLEARKADSLAAARRRATELHGLLAQQIEQARTAIVALTAQRDQNQAAYEAADGHQKDLAQAQYDRAAAAIRVGELQATLTDLTTRLHHAQIQAQTRLQVEQRLLDAVAEVNPHLGILATQNANFGSSKSMMEEAAKTQAEAATKLRQIETLATLFGPKGLRINVIEAATPIINERANHYASTIADGEIKISLETFSTNAKGERMERFTVGAELINKAVKGGKTYREFSTGERRKVDVAVALAFSDLIGARTSKPINVWAADELTQGLDSSAVARVVDVLREIAARRGTAMIISHEPITDLIPNAVVVIKDANGSRIEKLRWM